jgi:hypothetical protein
MNMKYNSVYKVRKYKDSCKCIPVFQKQFVNDTEVGTVLKTGAVYYAVSRVSML